MHRPAVDRQPPDRAVWGEGLDLARARVAAIVGPVLGGLPAQLSNNGSVRDIQCVVEDFQAMLGEVIGDVQRRCDMEAVVVDEGQ